MGAGHRGIRGGVVLASGMLAALGCGSRGEMTAGPGPETGSPAAASEKQDNERVDLGGGVTLELVLIQPGTFTMGSETRSKEGPPQPVTKSPHRMGPAPMGSGARDQEKPSHPVTISRPFYLGKFEVTREQWRVVMGTVPGGFLEPRNPVTLVSWEDCQGFLARLNERVPGPAFTLPTEAQWEYACRAESTTDWSCGDDEAVLADYAWFGANSDERLHAVGGRKPNTWGLYDMHGNVREVCADRWDGAYYANAPSLDPPGPSTGPFRCLRGGAFLDEAGWLRSAFRDGISAEGANIFDGFRVARGAP